MKDSNRRINDETEETSGASAILAVCGESLVSLKILSEWMDRDPMFHVQIRSSIDGKHLYDDRIWELYTKVCGGSLNRFIYHVQMELPDQLTGEHRLTGSHIKVANRSEFAAKRRFGKPGSYWALESPPDRPDYAYPIV